MDWRFAASLVLWFVIEMVDLAVEAFSSPWWLSGLIAFVIIYGGVLILDGDVFD